MPGTAISYPLSDSDYWRAYEDLRSRQEFRLRAEIKARSKSKNSLRGYEFDFAKFKRWAQTKGVSALPASPSDVSQYLMEASREVDPDGQEHYRVSTFTRWVTSIDHFHAKGVFPEPGRHPLVTETLAYLRMTMSRPVRRWRALQGDDISALINSLEYDTLHSALRSIRDKCLIQLGFDGAFRRSELTGIRLRDITFLGERGAEVFLPKSKTDQEGKGFTKAILRRRDPAVCTPCAMRRLITVLEAQASGPSALQAVIDSVQREPDHVCDQLECSLEEEDFLFRPIAPLAATSFKPKMMRGEDVHHMLRERLTTLGYDARQYGAHSLRIGFVTQAAANGATLEEIKHQTGHSSDSMVILYIRLEDAFQNNAVNKLWLDD